MESAPAEWVEIEKLVPWEKNPRINDGAVNAVARSIKNYGFSSPIIARKKNNMVIAGHTRLKAARTLGIEKVPVRFMDLDEVQSKKLAIIDNKSSEIAEWDIPILEDILGELEAPDIEELGAYFSDDELNELLNQDAEGLIDDDEIPEVEEAITKSGDLWILGEHRVLCGDATKKEDVEQLMEGKKADICFTSPPYNLGKSSKLSGNNSLEKRGNAYTSFDDGGNEQQWHELVDSMMTVSRKFCDVVVFNVQPLAGNKRVFWKWIAELSDCLVDVLVWNKGHSAPQIAKGVCSSTYELLVIVGKDGASRAIPFATWKGTIQSVYSAPRQTQNEFASIHGATFPLHLPAFIIGELCNRAKSVYDCCIGTGTTLIACEQLNRQCYGMEIDPHYCDVIVKRWEEYTGKKAILDGD